MSDMSLTFVMLSVTVFASLMFRAKAINAYGSDLYWSILQTNALVCAVCAIGFAAKAVLYVFCS